MIEVRADAGQMSLNLRMRSGGILLGFDHLRHAGQHELTRTLEGFVLQLPDPVHENVARTQGAADQSSAVALHNFHLAAHIADDNAVESAVQPRKATLSGRLAK